MRVISLLLAALLAASSNALAQPNSARQAAVDTSTPTLSSTNAMMAQARTQAAAEHKNILLVFSASWCGPCHLLEAFLKDPETGPIMGNYFVPSMLDVGEHPDDKRHSNTPGAEALRASLKGAKAGYPYIVMLDPTGNPIANSFCPSGCTPPGENIGYPATPGEIAWFMKMVRQGAPGISAKEARTIESWLQKRGHA